RKAKKSGISVTNEISLKAMKEFYRLNCLTRREHGLPPQPWAFFKNLFNSVIAKGQGFISIVRHKEESIAADLFLLNGEKAIYKYGASNRKFFHLRPNNLLIWEGMLHCKALGARVLNLGRTELHHAGLLQFKRGMGCEDEKIDYFRYDCKKGSFQKGDNVCGSGFRIAAVRHAPLFTLRLLGNFAYKYMG
ncbi:MAG TPA: methicillin resistance protein, partial [Fibrobacteres bacterium]|nr:methicillin resistance protein [Fibrobacterota bacterium]